MGTAVGDGNVGPTLWASGHGNGQVGSSDLVGQVAIGQSSGKMGSSGHSNVEWAQQYQMGTKVQCSGHVLITWEAEPVQLAGLSSASEAAPRLKPGNMASCDRRRVARSGRSFERREPNIEIEVRTVHGYQVLNGRLSCSQQHCCVPAFAAMIDFA